MATNLYELIFNQHEKSDIISLHTYKIVTHPKLERSNLYKHREQLCMQNPSTKKYLGQTCKLGEEPTELLSIKLLTSPVLFESKLNDRTYRVSITHHKESTCRETLRTFVSDYFYRLLTQVFPISTKNNGVLYCPEMKRNLKSAELEAWPGFKYDVVL